MLTEEQLIELKTFIPDGWFKTFGKELIKDLNEAMESESIDDLEILDIKEKYYELRIYTYPYNEKVEQVINKYTILSRNYCPLCGSVNPCKQHPNF